MKPDLIPTHCLPQFRDLTPQWLARQGFRGILIDLDDTLAARGCTQPDGAVTRWVDALREAGIGICIVSNNHKTRTTLFARPLHVGFVYNAFKPFLWGLRAGLDVLGLPPEQVVFVGDQLFTDIRAANRLGLRSVLVDPIGPSGGWFVDFKRKREEPLRAKLKRAQKKES